MEAIDTEATATIVVAINEALEDLVSAHPRHLDNRAAQYRVEPPLFSNPEGGFRFQFRFPGSRTGGDIEMAIEIRPSEEAPVSERNGTINLEAFQLCSCGSFDDFYACEHTLASAWWLQEQLNRGGSKGLHTLLEDLREDPFQAGREFVDTLVQTGSSQTPKRKGDPDRLQWRVSLSDSPYQDPVAIRAFLQRPKKNGRGFTKGREIRDYDLVRRNFDDSPIDGRIAVLFNSNAYGIDDRFVDLRGIELLVDHPNVALDSEEAPSVEIRYSDVRLSLRRSDDELPGSEPGAVPAADAEPDEGASESDPKPSPLQEADDDFAEHAFASGAYVPQLRFSRYPDFRAATLLLGHTSPAEPILLAVDESETRWLVCPLGGNKAAAVLSNLLTRDLDAIRIDAETAAELAVASHGFADEMALELPDELSGPLEDFDGELVARMTPGRGSGLVCELVMVDSRYSGTVAPGDAPETLLCLTPEGPCRLQRDLAKENEAAQDVVARYRLSEHPRPKRWRFELESDREALDLLAAMHSDGESAPRIIWPKGETFRVRGEITPSSLKVQIDDRRDWFGLEGTVKVGDREITLGELLSAVRDRRELVRVGDAEFAKINEAFRRRLEQLSDTVVAQREELRIADALVPVAADILGEDIPLEAQSRWHDSIARLDDLQSHHPDPPSELSADLRPYQIDGYRWLSRLSKWGVGGVLADDMGLGKTVQTLGVLLERRHVGPTLVVAPTSVGENWVRETLRFAPELTPKVYRDADRETLVREATAGDLVILSYQLLQRDIETIASRSWGTLVLDEAQFIKNAQTKTSRAIRSLDAEWRIGLSGTPLENHLGELWSLFRTLSPGLLGSWQRFRTRFAEPIERQKDPDRRASLAAMVQPFILRRTKDAVLKELPSRTSINLSAELSPVQRKLYEDTRIAAVADLESGGSGRGADGKRRIQTLAWLTKLRQLACHPKLVDATWTGGSAKLDLLMRTIDELREGDHRALVFSQFVGHLALVRQALDERGVSYQYLDGSTPAATRSKSVDAFQAGEGDLFLISLKAGGTGLNLTAADYVLHLDPWWNPAVEDQATDRAHRIGQQKPVTVYRFVTTNTIEEKILALHADKRELVSGILDGTDRAGTLNTDELIELIRGSAAS